ncbi:MAG TPA: SpoVR family protein [Ktedonobacteraceae bacterium]|nr:SpoVR family protein [Ktedonobacteraceae bacterium]
MTIMDSNGSTSDIERLRDGIDAAWEEAHKFGLDPFPTHFELVPASIMYEFASYSLPGRFSHWTHGKSYYRQKMQYDLGLSKIYEMVVNTNPSYAFLMDMNDLLQNTFVAAHVFGHTDFFKNNAYFQHTSRRMIDKASIHAERIAKYEFDHGKDEVEHFLDAALSIQEHVDYNLLLRDDEPDKDEKDKPKERLTEYDDLWGLEKKARKAEEERDRFNVKPPKFPEKPEKDILLFLVRHAPHLQPWQRDILEIVRLEMLYFVPQMQTKVMNEGWACLVANSLVLTEHGFLRYGALHECLAQGNSVTVASGSGAQDMITDRHIRHNAATVRLRTRRGLVLEGAEGHKLSIGPDQWMELKDVSVGQRIPLSVGDNIWPKQLVSIAPSVRVISPTVEDVAQAAGVGVRTIYRSMSGKTTFAKNRIDAAIQSTGYSFGNAGKPLYSHRSPLLTPTHVTEAFAEFLGYLVGDGNIHVSKNAIGYASGDRELADRYAHLVTELFAIEPSLFWDDKTANGKGGRWRVVFYSVNVLELLQSLGIDLHAKARAKSVPDVILRSPKAVVSAFLRAYFDCDGCASVKEGVILSTFSDEIAQALQIVLLNYGILSRRNGVNIRIKGKSAQLFAQEINFWLPRKRENLQCYLDNHRWFLKEDPNDEVVSIEHDVADVYDITVDRSHQYVANGMLHHNSIWHSRIMRELGDRGVISDSEVIEFAQLHSGVLSPSRTSLNPYYIGFKMFEDIERRWDNPTTEERERLGRKPGMGRQKIFDVRELDNDVSFLRNYLTEDLIKDLDLYLYKKEGDEWVIVEKNWQKVRDGIVNSMTNFGYPYLVIENGDYRGNRELYIKHLFEGQELDLNYAEKTLQYVYTMWGRPVHLETVYENKRILLTYDGERNSKSTLEK